MSVAGQPLLEHLVELPATDRQHQLAAHLVTLVRGRIGGAKEHEVAASQYTKNSSLRGRECSHPGGHVDGFESSHRVPDAPIREIASPGGERVPIPLDALAVRQLDHEPTLGGLHNDRCFVGLARLAADRRYNTERATTSSCRA